MKMKWCTPVKSCNNLIIFGCTKPNYITHAVLESSLTNRDGEVDCRISKPFGVVICHIDDLDISDSITVSPVSLGLWHSPLASRVL